MKVYVAGPLRGKVRFNFPEFDRVSEIGRKAGHTIINPAGLDRDAGFDADDLPVCWDWSQIPPGFDMKETVKRDVNALMGCDAYVLLEGWEKSQGAVAEQKLLQWLGAVRLDPATFKVYEETQETQPRQTGERENPKDICGKKKAPLELLPWTALAQLAAVMKLGADKYGKWNWRTDKPSATIYYAAAMRHLAACLDGEDIDAESGQSHLAHAMACCAILLDASACGTLEDDRNKSGKVSEILKKLTE